MGSRCDFAVILAADQQPAAERLSLFAVINLGGIESLSNGVLGATAAVERYYFADNCLFVRRQLRNKLADRVMSHGTQLPDLFDALPREQARREFLHELAAMRALCLEIQAPRLQIA